MNITKNKKIVAWFSGGATSAVACKLALQKYKNVEIAYIETGSHHPDSIRFLHDCEKWFNKKIIVLKSKYKNHFDVFERVKFLNGPSGASCTGRLKTRVRQQYEYENPDVGQYVWGFEIGAKEEARAEKIKRRYPDFIHHFPLIENNLNKASCLLMLEKASIKIPEMYKLGYHNNNCIGCVKGGKGYWNKIRKDFPDVFYKMAKIEREIGHSCLKDVFLDELDPEAGRNEGVIIPACSIFCEFVNID